MDPFGGNRLTSRYQGDLSVSPLVLLQSAKMATAKTLHLRLQNKSPQNNG